jgi:hypothetical protein
MRFRRILYNFLPYYITKKIVRYTGEGYWMRPKGSSAEWSAIGYEIDYGEWLIIADREAILKERAVIEKRLKRNQERLDELERTGV